MLRVGMCVVPLEAAPALLAHCLSLVHVCEKWISVAQLFLVHCYHHQQCFVCNPNVLTNRAMLTGQLAVLDSNIEYTQRRNRNSSSQSQGMKLLHQSRTRCITSIGDALEAIYTRHCSQHGKFQHDENHSDVGVLFKTLLCSWMYCFSFLSRV